jgi:ferredoxin-nitrate reductase
VVDLARHFAQAQGVISLWSMGLNQSTEGVHNTNALINLHLATGHIGKPGAGPFSLTGQPNAMGGREVGGLAHLLPGYRSVTDPAHRADIARLWGVPVEALAARPGYAAMELFEAVDAGRVRALWILATNPVVSCPETDLIERALRKAEFVVVQDAYHPTDTSQYADVLLPAAQWPEKEGTMTNSERRITYLPQILAAPGEALPDWRILTLFAQTCGWHTAFPYTTAEEIFEEYKRCTQGRPTDITGVSYARLREGPVQWPCPSAASPGTERLYTDQHFPTPDGKARFIPVAYEGPAEPPDATYPIILTTGRVKNHWHTRTRTGKVEVFNKRDPEPYVQMHPTDARHLGIHDADFVEVIGKRGKVIAQARVTAEIVPGTCFIPFHWGRLSGFYKAANNLTLKAHDPVSKQPALKFAAVTIKKIFDVDFPD